MLSVLPVWFHVVFTFRFEFGSVLLFNTTIRFEATKPASGHSRIALSQLQGENTRKVLTQAASRKNKISPARRHAMQEISCRILHVGVRTDWLEWRI